MDALPMDLTMIYAVVMTFAAVGAVIVAKATKKEPIPIRVEDDSPR
jgi:hypothetical protein